MTEFSMTFFIVDGDLHLRVSNTFENGTTLEVFNSKVSTLESPLSLEDVSRRAMKEIHIPEEICS